MCVRRLLKVAIVGVPNAGKSTLINNIVTVQVCPVSKRVHTTRSNQHVAYLQNNTQVVFIDTPGLVNLKEIKKFKLSKDFAFGPEASVRKADVVGVIHDVSNAITRNKLDPRIIGLLNKMSEKNVVLILNKVDALKQKHLLLNSVRVLTSGVVNGQPIRLARSQLERNSLQKEQMAMDNLLEKAKKRQQGDVDSDAQSLDEHSENHLVSLYKQAFSKTEISEGVLERGWPGFNDVFMVSALTGDGVPDLTNYFVQNAKEADWAYNQDFLTDVRPQELVRRVIKSLLLDNLPQEIPYKVEPVVEFWDMDPSSGTIKISIAVNCVNERYMGRIIGSGGTVISKITADGQQTLSNLLKAPVDISIHLQGAPGKSSKS